MADISQLTSSPTAITPGLISNQRRHCDPRVNHFPVTTTSPSSRVLSPVTLKAFALNPGRNSSRSGKPKPWVPRIPFPSTFKGNLVTATLISAGTNLLYMLLEAGGGGGRNNAGNIVRGGGGGGEAGQSSSFLSRLFSLQGLDKEGLESESGFYRVGSPVYMLGMLKKYTISDVLFFDRRLNGFTDPAEDPLFKLVNILPGEVCTRSELQKELDKLRGSGLFKEVDIDCKRNRDGTLRLRISFLERTWQQLPERFRCINVGMIPNLNPEIESSGVNKKKGRKKDVLLFIKEEIQAEYSKRIERSDERPCLLPMALEEEISDRLRKRKNAGEMSSRVLVKIKELVQQWYDDHGYACAQVIGFTNLNTEELVCEVAEGNITRIQVVDALRNDSHDHHTASVVESVLPYGLRRGEVFNIEDAEAAKLNIEALGLFSSTEIDLGLDEENGGGVIVKFKVEKKTNDDSVVDGSSKRVIS